MVKDLDLTDLVLVELLKKGSTNAPAEVLHQLSEKGLIVLTHGKEPSLSMKGKRRAKALRHAEHDLRLLFGVGPAGTNRSALHAVGVPGAIIRG